MVLITINGTLAPWCFFIIVIAMKVSFCASYCGAAEVREGGEPPQAMRLVDHSYIRSCTCPSS
ncbi:hypothetical protein SCHPADRAFT_480600 [Schizopora paradoxa]|uniref:Uncharacterized protein n=1 Tax=Schizopora paradoxa TaxID=27342 RepID=A0A0H2RHX3_9AGAM|nr:hypothetical protein SCHPADRAFT_480600 [Schizopora paradoxa]